jgi:MEDS: MEthanogen/methylotroph, DcmR Sensory domain
MAVNSQTRNPQDFWGELGPVAHSVQIYANDESFLNTLDNFVRDGLRTGDTVILVTTLAHRTALEKRMTAAGINLEAVKASDQFITLDAHKSLDTFMVDGYPNEEKFNSFVSDLMVRAHKRDGRVRAFGEMVAMLWAHGNREATLQLEKLWDNFCDDETFCLFCAYPKDSFVQDIGTSLAEIYAVHARVIPELTA